MKSDYQWHHLKTWPKYFNEVHWGQKTFEIRRNDRDFRQGDFLALEEWDPETEQFTERVLVRRIGSIVEGEWDIPDGICVMALLPV